MVLTKILHEKINLKNSSIKINNQKEQIYQIRSTNKQKFLFVSKQTNF